TVEAARSRRRAISRIDEPEAIPREMSSRSASVSANRERRRAAGGMPPRGNNTARIQLCGLSKRRPISCSDCPAFQRLQTSRFSIAESPNRIPGLMPTPPSQSRFTSDGVASTFRMHPTYRELTRNRRVGQRERGLHESFWLVSPYSSVSKPRGGFPLIKGGSNDG